MGQDSFSTFPGATRRVPKRFKVAVPQDQLDDMINLLKLSKLAPKTYENSMKSQQYGVTRDWMVQAKKAWENFNW
jgi:microsomal epoxide hydrolase